LPTNTFPPKHKTNYHFDQIEGFLLELSATARIPGMLEQK
jgi:hypothetical protein